MSEVTVRYPTGIDANDNLLEVKDKKQTALSDPLTIGELVEIVVASTSGFPDIGYLTIDNEVIKYDAKEATKFKTLTRGCQSTSAAAHLKGSKVYLNVLAIHHNILKDTIIKIEQELGISPKGTYTTVEERLANILKYVSEYKCFEVVDY